MTLWKLLSVSMKHATAPVRFFVWPEGSKSAGIQKLCSCHIRVVETTSFKASTYQHGPRCSLLIASCLWKRQESIPRSKLLPATDREIEEDTGYHRVGSMEHSDDSEPCLRGPCLKTMAYSLQHTPLDELGLGFREVLTGRLAPRLCQEWEWCFIRCRFMRPCSSNL